MIPSAHEHSPATPVPSHHAPAPGVARGVTSRRSVLAGGGVVLAGIALTACGSAKDAATAPSPSVSPTPTNGGGESSSAPAGGASDAGSATIASDFLSSTRAFEPERAASANFDPEVPYLVLGQGSSGPVVDVLIDYRCPHCKHYAEANHADLKEAVESGAIELHVYPRPMLDVMTGTTFSRDTASAAAAMFVQDPALFWAADEALFSLQPTDQGQPTPSTKEIAQAMVAVGASPETVEAIQTGVYAPWTRSVEGRGVELGVGTPTTYVDGRALQADPYVPGTVLKAIRSVSL